MPHRSSRPRESLTVRARTIDSGSERQVKDVSGRRGLMGQYGDPTDGHYVYVTWREDVGDIWVMEVGDDGSEPGGSLGSYLLMAPVDGCRSRARRRWMSSRRLRRRRRGLCRAVCRPGSEAS